MENDGFENELATCYISDGILIYRYREGAVINLRNAIRIVAERLELQDGRSLAVFCDISGIADSDKAGRDYLAQYGSVLTKAVALYTESHLLQIMTCFYLRVSKPQVPTMIFTDERQARLFLSRYI
ncbi:DUF7793 family protein [Flavobacterium macacae]|uniref:DUF7793 domain-containing protein n=1 Tax=Flavobacterium macacae TaxID=2488993 RepID=A0A3P3W7V0_9FLAO|nr:hypothetical protein [Flavobacterium macacae]RRJ90764.1 hypothetical protein EG849_09815 [Flavobacterium macacae]